jgi:hypothetical protein
VTNEDADIFLNGIIPDLIIQTGHHSPDEHSLAVSDHLADTKTLNASKQHYHKKSMDFGFAEKQRTAFSPETPPFSRACFPINLVRSCGSR